MLSEQGGLSMSVTLMSAVWPMDLPTTDKMVLLALADAANDDGVTWIAVKSRKAGEKLDILKKCSLKERAVQGAIKRLCDSGLLTRDERPGKGVIYRVTPAGNAAPQEMRPAGKDVNPRSKCGETVSNHHTSEANASSVVGAPKAQPRVKAKPVKRSFVPDEWEPKASHVVKARELQLDLREEIESFRNHEFKTPKSDFDRAFHTWLTNSRKWNPRRDNQPSRPSKLDHLADVFGAMGIADEFRPDHRGDQGVPCIEGSVRVLPPAA